MAYIDYRNRSPKVEILPDLRQRVTRVGDIVQNEVPKNPTTVAAQPGLDSVLLAWGTPDVTYTGCRLIKQDISGQFDENGNNTKDPTTKCPIITQIFETISATAETEVGNTDITIDQDDLTECVQHFLQFSGQTPVFKSPGGSPITAPNGVSCSLKEEIRTDDGTLQRIERHYISTGLISQTTDTKYNGDLVLTTLVTVNVVPSTPGGSVLIDAKVDHPNGNKLYTYTYAAGSGVIDTQVEYRLSPDQGTTGVTVVTITALSAPGAGNPISQPGGTNEISLKEAQQDGYIIWTGIYASGQGTIATEVVQKFDGALTETTVTAINAAPTGTGTLIKTDVRNGTRFEDGTIIYTYTWANVPGGATGTQIGLETEYLQSIDLGTNGVTRTTIRQLTTPASSQAPAAGPGGTVLVKAEYTDSDGYRIWTTIWAKGAGLVLTETLVMEAGVMVVYHKIGLGGAPSTPSGTIGGTVTLFQNEIRNADGYQIYDYRWVEANGQSSLTTRGEPDGAVIFEVVIYGATAAIPPNPGGTAYNTLYKVEQKDGYFVNTAVWHQLPATVALRRRVKFQYPGTVNILSLPSGLQFVPPVERDVLATETISYATSQDTTAPFSISAYCSVSIAYTPTNQPSPKQTVSNQKAAGGYLSGATGDSGTNSIFNGILCDSWSYTISSSTPSAGPTGSTVLDNQNEIYLTDITGTRVFRNRKTTFSF